MKPDCLIDRDLILLHYGEAPDGTTPAAAAAHLAACDTCRTRSQQLAADLARIPAPTDPDPAVATRIAARVNERLGRKPHWLPLAGAATASAIALAMAVIVWLPGNQPPATGPERPAIAGQPQVASIDQTFVGPPRPVIRQATLDLDLLDKLEMLEELEILEELARLQHSKGV